MTSAKINQPKPVWDPFIRVFHWSLVGAFIVSQVTAETLDEIHEVSGYVIGGLIIARLMWSLIGPANARFNKDWVSPKAIGRHLFSVLDGSHRPVTGHNPAGGAMILLLMAALLLTALTGHLGQTDLFWGTEWISELHEALGEGLFFLVGVHVAAVVLMSVLEKRNLIRAMITGQGG